jgi:hypothetical protein
MPVTVVTGPPCAGKSSHIRARAAAGDVVIDLDGIAVALGSPDTHDHPPAVLAVARAARNAAIGEALRLAARAAGDGAAVWIVDAAPSPHRRRQYATAEVTYVQLTADRTELHQRATDAGRGPGTHRRIDAWRGDRTSPAAATSRPW